MYIFMHLLLLSLEYRCSIATLTRTLQGLCASCIFHCPFILQAGTRRRRAHPFRMLITPDSKDLV